MRRVFPALALAMLLASSLPELARGQTNFPTTPSPQPSLCFFEDAGRGDPDPSNTAALQAGTACPGGTNLQPPNYDEGDHVHLRLANVNQQTAQANPPTILITCRTGCYDEPNTNGVPIYDYDDKNSNCEVNGRGYWSTWRGSTLDFPTNFNPTEAPAGKACPRNATLDLVPRYNGTWEVTAFIPGVPEPLHRTFNVWLFTLYRSDALTVMPGEEHRIFATGLLPNETVEMRLERDSGAGFVRMNLPEPPPAHPDQLGHAWTYWKVPPSDAQLFAACPRTTYYCYRLVVHGSGADKADEVMPFRVTAADIKVDRRGVDPPTGATLQRAQTVAISAHLIYSHNLGYGVRVLSPELLPPPPQGQQPSITARVDRANVTGTDAPVSITTLKLAYRPGSEDWTGSWTVPKDAALDAQARYSVVIQEGHDAFGNHIASSTLGTFSVMAASMDPIAEYPLQDVARTQEAHVRMTLRYMNGSAVAPSDVNVPLRGCFVADSGDGSAPCTNVSQAAIDGTFDKTAWVFNKTWPRDYANLVPHHFVMLGTQDRWGNTLNGTTTPSWNIVPATQIVDFKTVMRGRAVTTLERTQLIHIIATITYADGSPYNSSVRYRGEKPNSCDGLANDPCQLQVNVTEHGQGTIVQTVPVNLTIADPDAGRWEGTMQLYLDERTPVGVWTFGLDVVDNVSTPNVHRDLLFERNVIAPPLRFEGDVASPRMARSMQTGATLTFAFRLTDASGAPVDGTHVRQDSGNGITAQVYKWDAKNSTATGEPLSERIVPQYDDPRGYWVFTFLTKPYLFNGPYVFVLTGKDIADNVLPQDAFSPPFSPYSPVVSREVLDPKPQSEVRRGEDASGSFIGAEGDTGVDGSGHPTIKVERHNDACRAVDKTSAECWVVALGAENVRLANSPPESHIALFPVSEKTPIGTYRFHFLGRDALLRVVDAVTTNFSVLPTTVTRAILEPPPETAVKGDLIYFTAEFERDDRFTSVSVKENGRLRNNLALPTSVIQHDVLNVSWKVPLDAPNGNYTLVFGGLDTYGNTIVIESPPIEVLPAQLQGRILGQPAKIVQRGTPAVMLFGITYPTGDYYSSSVLPRVFVYNQTGIAATATVTLKGITYEASWTPPAQADVGEYYLESGGQGAAGNGLPALRSTTFRLAPGTFERPGLASLPAGPERMDKTSWAVALQPSDRFVSFTLDYYGPTNDPTNALAGRPPLSSSPLVHTIEAEQGRYVARWITDERTPTGLYRITMRGEDDLGNTIVAKSNTVILQPTTIVLQLMSQSPQGDFAEGKTVQFLFSGRYKNGPVFEDKSGRPSVTMLYEGVPTSNPPTIAYDAGRWTVTWTAPSTLSPGQYTLNLGGTDASGNSIATMRALPYRWDASLSESFAKTVPGPEPVLMMLGILALALVLRRR